MLTKTVGPRARMLLEPIQSGFEVSPGFVRIAVKTKVAHIYGKYEMGFESSNENEYRCRKSHSKESQDELSYIHCHLFCFENGEQTKTFTSGNDVHIVMIIIITTTIIIIIIIIIIITINTNQLKSNGFKLNTGF